jgi:glycosyltransferase involved in cell wall biosynthesis
MIDTRNPDYGALPVNVRRRRCAANVAEPLVSILTPYYNTEELFLETAASIHGQTLETWEWIVVDDGSTDADSVARLHAVAAEDPRIRVVTQANAGPAAARNTAFRHSRGRFVCLLDSDDLIEPTYLETCAWFLESNPEFAFCNSWSVVFGEEQYLWTTGFETGKAHVRTNSGPPISVVRREAFERCGGFDESIRFGHEDWDFWLRLANQGDWGYTIRDFLQWYRKRSGGRFEQFMKDPAAHARFESLVESRYKGLDSRFPAPFRRHRQPYETTNFALPFPVPERTGADGSAPSVLFLVPWMVTGGADRVNLDLVEALCDSGANVTICAFLSTDHVWKHRFSKLTPDIFVLPDFLHASDYPRFLSHLIETRDIRTIVVCGAVLSYQLLPFLRSVRPGAAIIDVCHVEEPAWLNGGYPRLSVGYRDLIDMTITTTAHLREWMIERSGRADRIQVMYTGVESRRPDDLRRIRAAVRTEFGFGDDAFVLCFAGRVCAQKRPDVLASILIALDELKVDFRAFVVGDGDLAAALDARIAPLVAGGRVVRLGSVSHERWLALIAASDVFLLPSEYEGISVALLEAMAAGAVPVVSRVGGHDEVVGPDAGILIEHSADEVAKYCEAIRQLARLPELLQALSRGARAAISAELSREATKRRFNELLQAAREASRTTVPVGLGRELAVQAIESNRLSEAVDWLWHNRHGSSNAAPVPGGLAVRLALAVSRSRFGRWLQRQTGIKRGLDRVLRVIERRTTGSALQKSLP